MRSVLFLATLSLLAAPATAEVTRTHRIELAGDAGGGFSVENLTGAMTVKPGTSGKVVVTATVHGEDQAIVDSVRLVQDRREDGKPRLIVRYPVDRHTSYRGPGPDGSSSGWGWLASMFGADGSSFKYDGVRVRVGSASGVVLWADVQVEVPADVNGVFRNYSGPIASSGTRGRLKFDGGAGDITLTDVSGAIVADTGSGTVRARNVAGTLSCDTGSGDCLVEAFRGDRLDCDTGSGNVRVASSAVKSVRLDTGSGDVKVDAAGIEELEADTGSGDLDLTIGGGALRKVLADTGSGDVHLRMDPDASFRVKADLGSGDIVNRYSDAQPVVSGREVKGYTRGDGRTLIEVDTGSGDLVLEPAR